MKLNEFKFIKWIIGLPVKTKVVSAVVAGMMVVGSGVGIGIAASKSNEPEHTHSYTQQITTEATCTEKGVTTFTCSCNDTYTEEIPALGHDEETHQAQAPTCTEIGWEEYVTCQREGCEYSTYVEISALNHDKVQHNAQAATCTEKGWNAYETCSRCDYSTYIEIPASGQHTWNNGKITTEPTCTEMGVKTFTCTVCQIATHTENINALTHDIEVNNPQAPTCTEKGWDAYATCKREGCDYTTFKEIPALNHDKVQHNAQAATCTEKGWNAYETCTRCYYSTYVELPALNHDKVQHNAQAATCTEKGWNAYETCSRCDYTTYAEIPALTHDKVQHNAQAATCTEIGWEAYETCSRCDYTTYEEIPALDHDKVQHNAQAATCTEKGWNAYETCTRCDYSTYVELPALNHDKVQHNAQAATCTEKGWNAYETCSRCDYSTYVEIPALTHDKVQHNAQAATCTEKGWEAYETCTRCSYTTYAELPATGEHTWDNGKITTEPTCTKTGVKTFTCTVCKTATKTEDVPTLEHDYSNEWKYDGNNHWNECKCGARANVSPHSGSSAVCGQKSTCTTCGQEYGMVGAHNYATLKYDANKHWYECSCGAKTGETTHNGGNVTCTTKAVCSTCNQSYGNTLSHEYDTLKYNTTKHWYECTCGAKQGETGHSGGNATCTTRATCSTCHQAYGSTLAHEYNTLKYNSTKHWYECSCGAKNNESAHTGTAECGQKAICTVCNQEYGKLNAHNYTALKYNTEKHWYECSCGAKMGETTHNGGTATCQAKAVCSTCNQEYGSKASHEYNTLKHNPTQHWYECACGLKTNASTHNGGNATCTIKAVCSTCNQSYGNTLSHEYDTLKYNTTKHWYECVCGSKQGETTHAGGMATCTAKAVCSTCNQSYGNTLPHEYNTLKYNTTKHWYECACGAKNNETTHKGGNATCTTKAICSTCNQAYGNTADHIYNTIKHNTQIHWNECICGARKDETAHTLSNTTPPKCTRCNYVELKGELQFTATEDSSFYYVSGYTGYETHIEIPNLHDGLRVIRIAENAFRGNTHIESISLPNSIQVVDAYAFYGCTALKNVNIPESVKDLNEYTFANCTSLETVTLNYKITKIGKHAFENCSKLNEIIFLTNGVIDLEVIDEYAFANCISLANFHAVEVLPKLKTVGAYAFSKCTALELVSLPMSLETIENYAFENCSGLKQLYIGNSEAEPMEAKATIGAYAFTHCTALEYAVLTSIVQVIGNNAFEYCTAMQTVYFAEGLTTIQDKAFDYCTGLKMLTFPNSLITIGNMAFRHAEALKQIQFPTQLTTIGNASFQYCITLQEVTLPENITKIGNSAFSYCDSLATLSVLGDVTQWGNSTFYECQKLTNIYIASAYSHYTEEENYVFYNAGIAGDGITLTIGKTAIIPEGLFIPVERVENFPKITKIIVEDGATTVNAFLYYNYLPYLTEITMPDSVTSIPYGIFNNCPWWTAQEKGVVYIDNVFYGYKCECAYCTPSEIVVENYVDSDCVNDGAYDNVITCTVCNYEVSRETIVIPAKGHSPLDAVVENYVDSDCTNDGSQDNVIYCGVCDDELSRETIVIPAKGHKVESVLQNYTTTNAANYPFSVSGNQITSTNKSHNSSAAYTITAQRAFTLELQFKVSSESSCDYLTIKHNSTQITQKSGTSTTSFTALTISMQSGDKVIITYKKDGSVSSGSDCAWVKIITPATSTDLVDATEENIVPLLTCTEDVLCEACSIVLAEKLGHDYIPHDAQAATCLEIGWDAYNTCSRCDYNEYVEIPALGHDYIAHEAKEPTCAIGWKAYDTCSRCDYTTYVELPKVTTTHNVQNGYCVECNRTESSPGLKYSQNSDGTYTVTGIGSCTATNIVIGIYNNKSVTSIGGGAFRNCASLKSITIPDSVTSIGNNAFYNCSSLTSVYITNIEVWCHISFNTNYPGTNPLEYAENLYVNNKLVTEVVIPDGVTKIAPFALSCNSLTSVVIPDSVTMIGNSAFSNCDSLTSVIIPNSVTSIGSGAFRNCDSLTKVYITDIAAWCNISFVLSEYGGCYSNPLYYAKNLYLNNELVTELIIPDSVTSIANNAFYNYDSLTSVEIGNGVTSIGKGTFASCDSLTSVVIPNSVTIIGNSAFSNCDSLTSVMIPDSVTSIGDSAFVDCSSLTSVTIGNGVTSIGSSAFSETAYHNNKSNWENEVLYIGKYLIDAYASISGIYTVKDGTLLIAPFAFAECYKLTSVIIPDSVTYIGNDAFYRCSGLMSMIIPDSVTSIGNYVFSSCASLKSVTIPDSVTSIGTSAFYGCSSLTSITIPNKVTSIGNNAFFECYNLTSVVIPDSVTYIGINAFSRCTSLTSVVIGNGVTMIGASAFYGCSSLTSITFKDTSTWYRTEGSDNWNNKKNGTNTSVTSPSTNATYLKSTYCIYFWYKK